MVGYIHRYLQGISFLKAGGVLFYILSGLINIVLLQSKAQEPFDFNLESLFNRLQTFRTVLVGTFEITRVSLWCSCLHFRDLCAGIRVGTKS